VDTADIEIFLTLVEELHFGRTAERLHLTQPRVTRVIAALEARAGGKLFERTSRTVRLTPLGARLQARLRPAYAELLAAFADARQAASDKAGELRIGATATTQGEALTRLASAFEADHRGCRAVLSEVDILRPYEKLRNGEVDVLVNWLALDEPDLTAGPVIDRRERVLAVGCAHPLAKQRTVGAEELADYENTGVIEPPFPRALLDAIVPPRTPSGRPVRRISAHGIYEMLDHVARGAAVHPTLAGIVLSRRDDIVLIPIDGLPPLPLGLIWCTGHENARIRALADTARRLRPRNGAAGGQLRDHGPRRDPLSPRA
jgi:DNA-binding transcriptional LysR family regulator